MNPNPTMNDGGAQKAAYEIDVAMVTFSHLERSAPRVLSDYGEGFAAGLRHARRLVEELCGGVQSVKTASSAGAAGSTPDSATPSEAHQNGLSRRDPREVAHQSDPAYNPLHLPIAGANVTIQEVIALLHSAYERGDNLRQAVGMAVIRLDRLSNNLAEMTR